MVLGSVLHQKHLAVKLSGPIGRAYGDLPIVVDALTPLVQCFTVYHFELNVSLRIM